MRDLGAAYTAAKASVLDRSRVRVRIANHGLAGYEDPFDITDRVDSVRVTRSLRGQADAVSLTVGNKRGEFEPYVSPWGEVLNAGALVVIEAGEELVGVPTYWDLWRGYVYDQAPAYGTTDAAVTWQLRNRVRDLWGLQITSPRYGADLAGAWNPVDVVKDLFTRFGLLAAADFSLTALPDEILYRLQFENEVLMSAAQSVLTPFGHRCWFDYDGTLTSGRLVPSSWTPALTIPARAVKSSSGPSRQAPTGTRLLVSAGPEPETRPVIGDAEIVGTGRVRLSGYMHSSPNVLSYVSEVGGQDCVSYSVSPGPMSAPPITFVLTIAGPRGRTYREGYCAVSAARLATSTFQPMTFGNMSITDLSPVAAAGAWNDEMERFEGQVSMSVEPDGLGHCDIDAEFDLLAYPVSDAYPPIDVQLWDDDLIAAFGEITRQLTNRCAQTYDTAYLVATNEMEFLRRSVSPVNQPLVGVDLRIEPGDPITLPLPRQGFATPVDTDVWVQRVTHGFTKAGGETRVEGYLI